MSIRAVICDIYGTVLEVGPPPGNAAVLWDELCQRFGLRPRPLSLVEFDERCRGAIQQAHAEAGMRGVVFPEVFWPRIALTAWPELGSWPERKLETFLYEHAQLEKSIRLMAGAAEALANISRNGMLLGLCSNCQPYTLHELRRAFAGTGLALDRFHPQLRFFSFEAGFSKPNPAAFQQLEHALKALGIPPMEALMVGDRVDNDLLPAKTRGWQTWHLATMPAETPGGTWRELQEFLVGQTP